MADLLIITGARAADRAVIAPKELAKRTKTVHIDVDPAEIGKNMSTTVPVVGDVKVILSQLLAHKPVADTADWLEDLRARRKRERRDEPVHREGAVSPVTLMRSLGGKLDDDACVCVDVGQNQIWAAKHLPLQHGRFLTSGGLGTMGYSLPAALGAKTAAPGRQTVVVCGDGSFQMSMNELATMKNIGADVKIVMIRNGVLGLVNEIQNKLYSGPFGVDLEHSPDFEKIAAAYGIGSSTVADDKELDGALSRMFSEKGPYLLVCRVAPEATTGD
ncbi:Acetolactate synthase large subunit [bioreactor metagenome]|uniref:Acetolactate synthase large subunit n=1 Tax=bioreactor metagenome TaxID=1076179 RepID=A0A644YJW7_9ZZZZ